jgi:hypothetical protein
MRYVAGGLVPCPRDELAPTDLFLVHDDIADLGGAPQRRPAGTIMR